jgi:hypothetical protein
MSIAIGDWVQALTVETEADFRGEAVWTHAKPGYVGHVVGVDGPWITVTFERTGTTTDCHVEDLRWLCHADAGRAAAVARTSGN